MILESGRSPAEGNGNPLQSSCLENSMDRGTGGLSMGSQRVGQNCATNLPCLELLYIVMKASTAMS